MKKTFLNLLAILSVIMLSACASGTNSQNMVASVSESNMASKSSRYYRNVSVVPVTGGKETNPLWTSQVSSASFEQALSESLTNAGYLSNGGAYVLHAHLMSLNQPFMGLTFDVTSTVEYKIKSGKTNETVISTIITQTGSAGFSDAALGVERLKVANERSIKNNLEKFLDYLKHKAK